MGKGKARRLEWGDLEKCDMPKWSEELITTDPKCECLENKITGLKAPKASRVYTKWALAWAGDMNLTEEQKAALIKVAGKQLDLVAADSDNNVGVDVVILVTGSSSS